ncbi:McrC family protein [Pseudomonas baetica]|nr:McrC family protein [Pseudomonas baetica]
MKTQARSFSLVKHHGQNWLRLKPDLLAQESATTRLVLDTKWKLIEATKANATDKYGLAQADFYQLNAYGQNYLNGRGDVILIYPKTEIFTHPLPVFNFSKTKNLNFWVLPFCLTSKALLLPSDQTLAQVICIKPSALAAAFDRGTMLKLSTETP